jgi:hypothetical protein
MKVSFEVYDREFGAGITVRKMPMVFPYKYRIILHITWLQICFFISKSPWNK